MTIYIPKHLRDNIEIFKQMYDMVVKYAEITTEPRYAFSDYHWSLSNDPVKRFLDLCISNQYSEVDEEDYSAIINYLTALFYSVKGTHKIFDYLLNYNIIKTSKAKIKYTSKSIDITLDGITIERGLFCEAFEKFLCALLFFDSLKITINNLDITMRGELGVSINHGELHYQFYEAYENNS